MIYFCPVCWAENRDSARFCRACGHRFGEGGAEPVPEDSLLKKRYRIVGKLGHGGMAKVYKGEDIRSPGTVYAIKEMDDDKFQTPSEKELAFQRFRQEAQLLYRLKHSGLPVVVDFFARKNFYKVTTSSGVEKKEKNFYYLVMSYINGRNLDEIIREKNGRPFQEYEVLDWFIQIVDILDYLHSLNPPIIYRDLKPANIMVTIDGKICLVDFGIAKIFDPQSEDSPVGTLGYAPPEQYQGITDQRSDVYSLGATFHYLLTAIDPENDPAKDLNSDPYGFFRFRDIRELNPDVSLDLSQLIMQMLEPDWEVRPQTIKEIKKILQRSRDKKILVHEPITAVAEEDERTSFLKPEDMPVPPPGEEHAETPPVSDAETVPKIIKPRRSKGFAPAIKSYKSWGCIKNLEGHANWVNCVNFSPNGIKVVSGCEDGTSKIWDLITGKCIKTFGKNFNIPVSAVAFSPDGRQIASGGEDEFIKIWDVTTGKIVQRLKSFQGNSLVFSQDGTKLLSAGDGGNIIIWDVKTAKPFKIIKTTSLWNYSVIYSPEEDEIASGSDDFNIYIWDVKTGEEKHVLQGHEDEVMSLCYSYDGSRLVSGSFDSTAKIWDLSSGTCLKTLRGHFNWVNSVSYSPNGQVVASGSLDNLIKLWDVNTGECLATLDEHTRSVRSISFSLDGARLVSGSADALIKIWG